MDINLLDYELKKQNNNLNVLQECLKNINNAIQNTDYFDNSKDISGLLKDVQRNLDNCRNNISNLETLKKHHSDLENNSDEIETKNYNELSNAYYNTIKTTTDNFNNFLLKYVKSTSFLIDKKFEISNTKIENNSNETIQPQANKPKLGVPVYSNFEFTADKNFIENLIKKSKETHNFTINTDFKKNEIFKKVENVNTHTPPVEPNNNNNNNNELKDNKVLLISERKNKIFLPYKIDELNNILEHSKNFKNIQDIINKKFTIPLDKHKNSTISRFKETYNFMRKREKASITDSLDLALELAFNYKLNPAVILACKNLEELDTYLDCLELDELEKFNYFEVKYEFLPTKR